MIFTICGDMREGTREVSQFHLYIEDPKTLYMDNTDREVEKLNALRLSPTLTLTCVLTRGILA